MAIGLVFFLFPSVFRIVDVAVVIVIMIVIVTVVVVVNAIVVSDSSVSVVVDILFVIDNVYDKMLENKRCLQRC